MKRWLSHSADFPELAVGPNDVVVDVGCGVGEATVAMGRAGARVISVDIDAIAVALTRDKVQNAGLSRIEVHHSDCQPIPVADGAANVVVCTEVLEHVPDPPRFLSELARIGAPGARYLISVPDPRSERLMAAVVPASYFEPPNHVNVYEHANFDALLASVGLTNYAEPVYPHGFYWSIYWALGWASATAPFGPGTPETEPPLVRYWGDFYRSIAGAPRGELFSEFLDQIVPKSRVIVAVKGKVDPVPRRQLPMGSCPESGFVNSLGDLAAWAFEASPFQSNESRAWWNAIARGIEALPASTSLLEALDGLPISLPILENWLNVRDPKPRSPWPARMKSRLRRLGHSSIVLR